MATTFIDYTGDGNATKSFSFPSIQESDVKVEVDGVIKTSGNHYNITSYTTTGGGNVVFTSGNIPSSPAAIRIFRDTDVDSAKATYTAGSSVKAADLNANHEQLLFAAQEEQNQTVQTQDIKDAAVTSAKIKDGTIVNADVNASAAIEGSKIQASSGSNAGTMSAASFTKLAGIETAATADQTAAEIRTLVESASDSNVFTDADHSKLNAIEAGATADQTASEIKTLLQSDKLTVSEIADNAITTSKIQDAELSTLAGMQSATASKLADSTALTADIADLNQIDGMQKATTITDDDTKFPTSGAVVDYVAAQLEPFGGFEAIANEVSFPNTQPPAGVAISIADAAGIVVNGSGTSTTGRTLNGTTVTINNINSQYNSSTVASGIRFIVTSTGSGQVYNYHKSTLPESDLVNLSGDINDFNERYRVGGSNPTTSLDAGDLFYNTGTNKLLVYNATNSAWEETQSIGNFFINTISSSSATGGGSATPNGTAYRFTLSNAGTTAEQHLVSVDGVIQKPNSGTSQPSEGFAVDGADIILGAAPVSGASFFVITIGAAVGIGTPSNNTVTNAILQNGSVSTAKIQDDAVDGTKLADTSVTAGSYGSSTSIPSITVDAQGRITAASGNTVNTDLVGDTSPQLGGNLESNGNHILMADNNKIKVGDSGDLEIFHQGFNSKIADVGTGALILSGSTVKIENGASNETQAVFTENGAVELYHDNSKKLETTSGGATITGTCTATSFSGDGSNLTGTGVTSDSSNNTIAGTAAGDAISGGGNNSVFGKNAGTELTSGSENIAIGFNALAVATTSSYNTAIGNSALGVNTSGNSNVAIGYQAADANTTGNALVAVGVGALGANTTGLENTAIGSVALLNNTTASNNTAVGRKALQSNTTGNSNTAVGKDALTSNTTASYNIAFGKDALYSNTSGGYNTALGSFSMLNNTTGVVNTAVGYQTLYNNTTGQENIAVGHQALYANTTGNYNTALGKDALEANTTASNNTAVGYLALRVNTTGTENIAVGSEALKANTTASGNIAMGYSALAVNTTGASNTAIGGNALDANTTASNNTAVGNQSLGANTTGYSNTAMGGNALPNNTTGYQHTAIGRSVLPLNTTGIKNTAVGWNAGGTTTTGGHNVYVGTSAGIGHTTGSNGIYIGNVAMSSGGNEAQAICIGTSCSSKGNYRITFGTNANGRVYNQYTANATWTRESDIRLKKEIATNTDCGLDFINDLRTVTYKWRAPSEVPNTFVNYDANQTEAIHKEKLYGFIAQEVKEVLDKHNITDFNGWTQDPDGLQGISYEMFIMPLVKAVQELSAKVSALEAA